MVFLDVEIKYVDIYGNTTKHYASMKHFIYYIFGLRNYVICFWMIYYVKTLLKRMKYFISVYVTKILFVISLNRSSLQVYRIKHGDNFYIISCKFNMIIFKIYVFISLQFTCLKK